MDFDACYPCFNRFAVLLGEFRSHVIDVKLVTDCQCVTARSKIAGVKLEVIPCIRAALEKTSGLELEGG
nr:hypothetical protein [uncultured Oscillibacter sp.]